MRRTSKNAALAAGLCVATLTSWSVAGCAASRPGPQPPSVAACAEYAFQAIEHHVTVTRRPAPCRGLSQEDLNQAVAVAVSRASAGGRRAERRRRAGEAAPYVARLVSTLPAPVSTQPASPPWSGSSGPATPARSGNDLALDIVALMAWLITAGSGSYVLGAWMVHGGTLRLRRRAGLVAAGGPASPPTVIMGHFGLALAGLILWVIYLIARWAPLAWAAVLVLLPVAGLGMAMVTIGLPGSGRSVRSSTTGYPAGAGPGALRVGSSGALKTRLSPLAIAGHGVLAASTMILVLLAALGTAGT